MNDQENEFVSDDQQSLSGEIQDAVIDALVDHLRSSRPWIVLVGISSGLIALNSFGSLCFDAFRLFGGSRGFSNILVAVRPLASLVFLVCFGLLCLRTIRLSEEINRTMTAGLQNYHDLYAAQRSVWKTLGIALALKFLFSLSFSAYITFIFIAWSW